MKVDGFGSGLMLYQLRRAEAVAQRTITIKLCREGHPKERIEQ
jgi:hypothetical protein